MNKRKHKEGDFRIIEILYDYDSRLFYRVQTYKFFPPKVVKKWFKSITEEGYYKWVSVSNCYADLEAAKQYIKYLLEPPQGYYPPDYEREDIDE